MRKKIITALIGLLACIVCVCTFGGCHGCYETDEQGICFRESENGEYLVIGLDWAGVSDIVIPSTFEQKPVIGMFIDNEYFYDWRKITSIVIPESITTIHGNPFEQCDSLEKITVSENNPVFRSAGNCLIETESKTLIGGCNNSVIPDDESVITIGERAFAELDSLEELVIPDSIKKIENNAFSECYGLKSITLGNGITEIEYSAFNYCRSLVSIVIPEGVILGDYLFNGCESLTIYCEAEIKPKGWGNNWNYYRCPVVWNCKNNDVADDGYIYSVIDGIRYALHDSVARVVRQPENSEGEKTIPQIVNYKKKTYYVKFINDRAFNGCDKLTALNVYAEVKEIGKDAFYNCRGLKSIILPDELRAIGNNMFCNCSSLTDINIPDKVTSIGEYAFNYCRSLTNIILPDSITSIGRDAFWGCESLTEVTLPDGLKALSKNIFFGCDKLKEIDIPDSVTSIGEYAFYRCRELREIVIPDSVTSVDRCAFGANPNLIIYCEAKSQPQGFDEKWNVISDYRDDPVEYYTVIWNYKNQ